VQSILTTAHASNFASGQIRSSTADTQHGLGWADDGTSAVTIRFVYYGDANLDGTVDTLDFNALAANFGGTSKVWTQADFNYDTIVDTLDFNRLAANFGRSLSSAAPAGSGGSGGSALGALVPEPASTATLGLIAAAVLTPRRRRERCERR
jgi:hypothetical protein